MGLIVEYEHLVAYIEWMMLSNCWNTVLFLISGLILQQIHAQNKSQDQEQIAEMKDEIKELREKLDRTEFII